MLKQEDRGDCTQIGSTIKMHAKAYSELPKEHSNLTPERLKELAVLQYDNIYHLTGLLLLFPLENKEKAS